MAAYIHDMELDTLVDKVNSYISKHEPSISLLVMPTDGWQTQGVSYLAHTFQRPFVPISFFLQHFWVDMRDCHFLPSSIDIEAFSSEEQELAPDKKSKNQEQKGGKSKKATSNKTYQMALPINEGLENT